MGSVPWCPCARDHHHHHRHQRQQQERQAAERSSDSILLSSACLSASCPTTSSISNAHQPGATCGNCLIHWGCPGRLNVSNMQRTTCHTYCPVLLLFTHTRLWKQPKCTTCGVATTDCLALTRAKWNCVLSWFAARRPSKRSNCQASCLLCGHTTALITALGG